MKTAMASTSLDTHREITRDGTKHKQREMILSVLEAYPEGLTNKELRESLRFCGFEMEEGSVAGRMNDLKKSGVVVVLGKRKNPNGRTAQIHGVKA